MVLGLKEGLVECAAVCVKSVVILRMVYYLEAIRKPSQPKQQMQNVLTLGMELFFPQCIHLEPQVAQIHLPNVDHSTYWYNQIATINVGEKHA